MSELFLAISELFLALKNVRNLESKLSLAIFVCERVFDPDFESIFWMQLCKYKYPHFLKERFESEQIERVVQYEEGGGQKEFRHILNREALYRTQLSALKNTELIYTR